MKPTERDVAWSELFRGMFGRAIKPRTLIRRQLEEIIHDMIQREIDHHYDLEHSEGGEP